jgi:hypothetical protein
MPKSIALDTLTSVPTSRRRAVVRGNRVVHETLTLALGCVAAGGIALALYLVAPVDVRTVIVSAFLGLDQPFTSP